MLECLPCACWSLPGVQVLLLFYCFFTGMIGTWGRAGWVGGGEAWDEWAEDTVLKAMARKNLRRIHSVVSFRSLWHVYEVVTCQPAYFSVPHNVRHGASSTWCSGALNTCIVQRFGGSEGLHSTINTCLLIVPALGNSGFWTLWESRGLHTKDEVT